MKCIFLALFVAAFPLAAVGQSSSQKTPLPPHPNTPASQDIETVTIPAPGQTPTSPSAQAATAGYLEPAQVKALMHKMWLAEFRLNDLVSQVHPEKWKLTAAEQQSFSQSLDSLRQSMAAQEDWRGQFEARPDSLYLGFQTFLAISAVLPRVDGVAHSVARYENPSFGGQYSQSGNQLFDLQQQIASHLKYLLKNQDGLMLATQTNLASCQNELNYAERNKQGPATPMKNIVPEFKGRKRTARTTAKAVGNTKQAEAKSAAAGKPATQPPKTEPQN